MEAIWIDRKARDAPRYKKPRQPERIVAYFKVERERHQAPRCRRGSAAVRRSPWPSSLGASTFSLSAPPIGYRSRSGNSEPQQPTPLGRFQCGVQSVFRTRSSRCPSICSPLDCKVWTKESYGGKFAILLSIARQLCARQLCGRLHLNLGILAFSHPLFAGPVVSVAFGDGPRDFRGYRRKLAMARSARAARRRNAESLQFCTEGAGRHGDSS